MVLVGVCHPLGDRGGDGIVFVKHPFGALHEGTPHNQILDTST